MPRWRRAKCFMCTVSPARTKVRSKTVETRFGAVYEAVGRLKRHGEIPWLQSDIAKLWSSPRRAVTKKARRQGRHSGSEPVRGRVWFMRTTPSFPVLPSKYTLPSQSETATSAPATGWPRSRLVTQTSEDSRPSLRCTPKLVTSTADWAWNGASLP